jgi:hypothetical protein
LQKVLEHECGCRGIISELFYISGISLFLFFEKKDRNSSIFLKKKLSQDEAFATPYRGGIIFTYG